jgi:hypothetical protein
VPLHRLRHVVIFEQVLPGDRGEDVAYFGR